MFRPLVHSAAAIGVALALLAASLVFFLSIGSAAPGVTGGGETAGAPATLTPTPDLCGGCAMSLEIVAVNNVPLASPCSSDSGTVANPAKCSMAKGDTFTLQIVASALPAAGSYGTFQTFLGYGTLLYKPASPGAEIHWPDGVLALRAPAFVDGDEGFVAHADVGAFSDPLPMSTYTDELVELEMNCQMQNPTGAGHAHTLALLPYSDFAPVVRSTLVALEDEGGALKIRPHDDGVAVHRNPSAESIVDLRIGGGEFLHLAQDRGLGGWRGWAR